MTKRTYPEQHAFAYPRARATQEQLAARQQQAQQRPPSRTTQGPTYRPASIHVQGHTARTHPEDDPDDDPYLETADLEEPARAPTSIIRPTQPQPTKNLYRPAKPTRRLSGPPRWVGVALLCAGAGLFVMIVGWLLLGALGSWWQTQQNTWWYGYPRTYQVDAVVGHGDSPAHPSHFIAMNLHRQILVIEIPGGNLTRARIYLGPTLIGDGQDLVPVTVSFEDGRSPGKPDLYLHIGDQVVVFLNDGTQFVAPAQH